MFSGIQIPKNWLLCNGQILTVDFHKGQKDYGPLFSVIGYRFGGDGIDSFALPNLVGHIPIGMRSTEDVGKVIGKEQVLLVENQLPSHTHLWSNIEIAIPVSKGDGKLNVPTGNYLASLKNEKRYATYATYADTALRPFEQSVQVMDSPPPVPISVVQSGLCINYIICFIGSYPEKP